MNPQSVAQRTVDPPPVPDPSTEHDLEEENRTQRQIEREQRIADYDAKPLGEER